MHDKCTLLLLSDWYMIMNMSIICAISHSQDIISLKRSKAKKSSAYMLLVMPSQDGLCQIKHRFLL